MKGMKVCSKTVLRPIGEKTFGLEFKKKKRKNSKPIIKYFRQKLNKLKSKQGNDRIMVERLYCGTFDETGNVAPLSVKRLNKNCTIMLGILVT